MPDTCSSDPHAALAAAKERMEHLERAVATNRRIGMAIGILMARHGLTEEAAFDLLVQRSQHENRKVQCLAEDVIYQGDL